MKQIAVVGATVRAIAASVVQAGHLALAADLFGDLDLRSLASVTVLRRYPWSALTWLAQSDADAWCYTGGLENYPRLIERMANLKPLLGSGADCLRRVRDPFWLAGLAVRHDLAFPPIREAGSLLSPPDTGEWLRKPWRSAGGLNIETTRDTVAACGKSYFQQRITGEARSVALLSTSRQVEIVGVCRLHIGTMFGAPGPFVFAGGTTIPLAEVAEREELRRMAKVLHRAASLRGLWGFDYIAAERTYLLEVNPRWTATMALHERAASPTGSLMARHIAACSGRSSPPVVGCRMRHTMQIVYATNNIHVTEGILAHLRQTTDLAAISETTRPSIADLPMPGTRIEAGQPVCTLYEDGATVEAVSGRLESRVARVQRILQGDSS